MDIAKLCFEKRHLVIKKHYLALGLYFVVPSLTDLLGRDIRPPLGVGGIALGLGALALLSPQLAVGFRFCQRLSRRLARVF